MEKCSFLFDLWQDGNRRKLSKICIILKWLYNKKPVIEYFNNKSVKIYGTYIISELLHIVVNLASS